MTNKHQTSSQHSQKNTFVFQNSTTNEKKKKGFAFFPHLSSTPLSKTPFLHTLLAPTPSCLPPPNPHTHLLHQTSRLLCSSHTSFHPFPCHPCPPPFFCPFHKFSFNLPSLLALPPFHSLPATQTPTLYSTHTHSLQPKEQMP